MQHVLDAAPSETPEILYSLSRPMCAGCFERLSTFGRLARYFASNVMEAIIESVSEVRSQIRWDTAAHEHVGVCGVEALEELGAWGSDLG